MSGNFPTGNEYVIKELKKVRQQLDKALETIAYLKGRWEQWDKENCSEEDGSEEEEEFEEEEFEEEDGSEEEFDEEEKVGTWDCCDAQIQCNSNCKECGQWWCPCDVVHRETTKKCGKCRRHNPNEC